MAPHREVLTPLWALAWPRRTFPALLSLPTGEPCSATLTLSSVCLHLPHLCQGYPHANSLMTYRLREPHSSQGTSLSSWATLQKLRDYLRLSIRCVAPLAQCTLGECVRGGVECVGGVPPDGRVGLPPFSPGPTCLGELDGMELGEGKSHGWFLGENVTKKRPVGPEPGREYRTI